MRIEESLCPIERESVVYVCERECESVSVSKRERERESDRDKVCEWV